MKLLTLECIVNKIIVESVILNKMFIFFKNIVEN